MEYAQRKGNNFDIWTKNSNFADISSGKFENSKQ